MDDDDFYLSEDDSFCCSEDDSDDRKKTPLDFFVENRQAAGFDFAGRCLYATIRELVENALESAESISELPCVEIEIEEIDPNRFESIVESTRLERIDDDCFQEFTKRKERFDNKALNEEIVDRDISIGDRYYKVTCKENGKGIPHDAILDTFGRVFAGEKYGLKQTRARFPLGVKMALIWSQLSTGLPIKILSSTKGQDSASFCLLDIDLHQDNPHHRLIQQKKEKGWHGAEIQFYILGNWTGYGPHVVGYMRQMAVITPYAEIDFKFVSYKPDKNVDIRFSRKTDEMPAATKYHPSVVDLQLIKCLIAETSEQYLLQFLQHEFVNVKKSDAEKCIEYLGTKCGDKLLVKSLTTEHIERIHDWFGQFKFDEPGENCLVPVGAANLVCGIKKELEPNMVAFYSGSAQLYEGHPFIVEAAVCLGGKYFHEGLEVFRSANRAPLLCFNDFDVWRSATAGIKWELYKIDRFRDKIGIFVSIVSTKIPFDGPAKEYIGVNKSVIASAVKTCIEECCRKLEPKIVKPIQEVGDELECGGQLEANSARNNNQAPPAKQQKRKRKLIRASPRFRLKDLPKDRVTYWKMMVAVNKQKLAVSKQNLASAIKKANLAAERKSGESSGGKLEKA